jgi:hypothetical protein
MLNEGLYRGTAREWRFGKSSNKQTPFFELVVVLNEQEDEDGNWTPLEPATRRSVQFYLTEASVARSMANLRSLGYKDDDLARANPDHEEAFDFSGKEVTVRIKHETYMDKPREKVEFQRQSERIGAGDPEFLAAARAFAAAARKQKEEASGKAEEEFADE